VLLGVELAIKLSAVNTSRLDNQHTNMNTHVLHKHGLLLMNVLHKHAWIIHEKNSYVQY
jgi:hypothetical protein